MLRRLVPVILVALLGSACATTPGGSSADDPTATGDPEATGSPTAAATPTAAIAAADVPPEAICADRDDGLLWPEDADLRYASTFGGREHGNWLRGAVGRFQDQSGVSVGIVSGNFYSGPVPSFLHGRLTGDPPADVITAFVGGSLRACAERGLLAPLDDLWEERGWADVLPPAVVDLATVDGHRYWAPSTVQWNPVFHRTDLFAASGVEVPTTWDDLLAACDTFADDGLALFTSSGGWSPPTARWFTILDLRLHGAAFHRDLLAGRASWLDDRVTAVFEHWAQLIDRRCFVEDAASNSFGDAVEDLAGGDAAAWNIGEWLLEFLDEDVHGDLGFFAFPTLDEGVPRGEIALVQGHAVLANAADPDLARDLVAFLTADQQLADVHATLGRLLVDPRVDVVDDDLHLAGRTFLEEADEVVGLLEFSTEPTYATTILSGLVRFSRDPAALEDVRADLEQARERMVEAS